MYHLGKTAILFCKPSINLRSYLYFIPQRSFEHHVFGQITNYICVNKHIKSSTNNRYTMPNHGTINHIAKEGVKLNILFDNAYLFARNLTKASNFAFS